MNKIVLDDVRRHKRLVWSMPICADNLDQMIQVCWQKVASNGWGMLTLRASQGKVEFDLTLSEVGEEVL